MAKTTVAKTDNMKGPVRVGAEETGWVHEVPKEGQGGCGAIVKALGCTWEEAENKMAEARGDYRKVLKDAGK
eukprot:CAMPEP_0174709920 /NCGR_PEP_ID=MMETSP1094-20130205/11714_1 /TAXON_ID=156173 /ORGANISM="Chrysochromulina brevifilum, Strain UTEX LB 985" /LENGTH=71 /DNA_ID=CAMNT_0015908647 /DNA_START=55 /DNA_END=270 /DNA_ORIENTATION=+